jgi:hypothetical protein
MPPVEGEQQPVPFGDVVQLPDGTLGVTAYCRFGWPDDRRFCTVFMRSRDDGRTWGEPVRMSEASSEADLLVCPDGTLLAAVRTDGGGHLTLLTSSDSGASWERGMHLTGPREHPAHMLHLADGHVLLVYGIRHRGHYAIGARVSEDNGASWCTPGVLVDLDHAWDGGYPYSVQLADGTIVTAYYASGIAAHSRYHMGVVRWEQPEVFEKNTKSRDAKEPPPS